jgi:transposase
MIRLIPQEEVASISYWKEITKAYKYETMPTRKQEVETYRTINTCKDLYNFFLGERKDAYEKGGWSLIYEDQQADIKILREKKDELGEKLKKVYE